MFIYGTAGAGKTTAAIQFPKAYVIDCERGTDQYDRQIIDNGGVVYQTSDMAEVIAEVKSLLTERHDYRTLVIDPITTAYNDLIDKCEQRVGADFGRHIQAANKEMKRLANLILALDMNVLVTAHAKKEYGDNMKVVGVTFDGWRSLDYWFDLVIEINRKKGAKDRMARIVKTRIPTFPDQEAFQWSYDAICERYDAATLDREAAPVAMATPEQVAEIKALLSVVRLPEGTTDKWLSKAGVETWEDMNAETLAKCIDYVKNRLPTVTAA
jgi:hypothetical protein